MMRLLAPLFVLLLMLGAPMAALAQDTPLTPPVLCGELDEADCAILESSQQAMLDVSSYAFDVNLGINAGGFPDMPVDPMALDITTTGSLSLDPTAAAAGRTLSELSLQGAKADAETIQDLPNLILDLYSGLALDVVVKLQVPEDLAAMMAAESDTPFAANLEIPIRMVDGTLYINIAGLRDLDPSLNDVSADWLGIDVVGAIEQSLADAPVTDQGANEAAMASAASGAMTMQVLKAIEPYVTVERMDNVKLGDQEGAVFDSSVDMAGFFADAQFRELVKTMVEMSATPESPAPEDLDQNLEMVGFMAPMIFRDLSVSSSSTIGLDDDYVYARSFDLVWDLAGLLQLAAAGDPALRKQLDSGMKPGFELHLSADLSDYNKDFDIQPPDDVEIIPLDQMSPMNEDVVS